VVRDARDRWVSAERTYRQASRAVSEATHPHLVAAALNGVAGTRLRRGERRGAREPLVRSLRLKERVGDQHQIAIAYSNLAEVELGLTEIPAALEHARRAVRLGEQVRAGADLADMYRNLAEALLAGGATAEALAAGQKALAIARSTGRIYLGTVAVTLSRACARAAEDTAPGDGLYVKMVEAASALRRTLAEDFEDPDLRPRAEECRAHLSRALLWP